MTGRAVHWIEEIKANITMACEQYERTAPTVHAWLDNLYIRIGENPVSVSMVELLHVESLREDGQWEQPNYAANRTYKMLARLGRDVSGQAGF